MKNPLEDCIVKAIDEIMHEQNLLGLYHEFIADIEEDLSKDTKMRLKFALCNAFEKGERQYFSK